MLSAQFLFRKKEKEVLTATCFMERWAVGLTLQPAGV